MFFSDIPDVVVRGLRGDATIHLQDLSGGRPAGVDIEKTGDFVLRLGFIGGIELAVEPQRGRTSSSGSVVVTAATGVNIQFMDCLGDVILPDGTVKALAGDYKFST